MINEVALANTLQINIWLMLSNFPNSSGGWRWQWEHWLWGVSHNDVGQGISHRLILIKQILILGEMLFCGTNVVLWDKCYFVGRYVIHNLWFDESWTFPEGEGKWGAWGHSGGVQSLWSGWRRVFSCLKFDQKRYVGSFSPELKWHLTVMWLFRFITCEELNHVMSTLGERLSRSDLYSIPLSKMIMDNDNDDNNNNDR